MTSTPVFAEANPERFRSFAPYRLLQLSLVARERAPFAFADCATTKDTMLNVAGRNHRAVTAPPHIMFGSLRRGFMGGIGGMALLAQEELDLNGRSELWKFVRSRRPEGVTEEQLDELCRAAWRHGLPARALAALKVWAAQLGWAIDWDGAPSFGASMVATVDGTAGAWEPSPAPPMGSWYEPTAEAFR
jgi:hypothetical protein